ncbi:hypothetical protein Q7P35_003741 [Cladosporium inversicolor]
MQSLSTLTLLLTALTVAGVCNASPRFIRPDQLPGARAVGAAATETGSPGLNSSLALNGTISTSSTGSDLTASVTETAPATTDPPITSSAVCIPVMMQVDYLHCGKRKGYRYDVNSCDGKTRSTPSLAPCSTTSSEPSS